MSENKQINYDDIRTEIENQYRAQLDDEVRKRKEIEEKYYKIYDALQEKEDELGKVRRVQYELTKMNRELLGCQMSYVTFLKQQRRYKRGEQDFLNKKKDFWTPVFDADYYAKHNEDVAKEIGMDVDALLEHFIGIGMHQGRRGCKEFDVHRYMELNQDIAERCKSDIRSAYLHYIDYGINEKRMK